MPPMTAAQKAFRLGTKPSVGYTVMYSPASIRPASTARPEPTAKVNMTTLLTPMPISREAFRFSEHARMAMPIFVFRITTNRAISATIVTAKVSRLIVERRNGPIMWIAVSQPGSLKAWRCAVKAIIIRFCKIVETASEEISVASSPAVRSGR